jgi:hypothetical protein
MSKGRFSHYKGQQIFYYSITGPNRAKKVPQKSSKTVPSRVHYCSVQLQYMEFETVHTHAYNAVLQTAL